VGREVVAYQADLLGIRVELLGELAHLLGKLPLRAPLGSPSPVAIP